jgi:outer membrane protein assembly factor BamD (BamD/ComL family)
MQLAGTLEDARRRAEAERAYARVVEEFPQSPFAGEARRRADYLKEPHQG